MTRSTTETRLASSAPPATDTTLAVHPGVMPAVETRAVVDPQNRRRETMRVGSEPHGDKAWRLPSVLRRCLIQVNVCEE